MKKSMIIAFASLALFACDNKNANKSVEAPKQQTGNAKSSNSSPKAANNEQSNVSNITVGSVSDAAKDGVKEETGAINQMENAQKESSATTVTEKAKEVTSQAYDSAKEKASDAYNAAKEKANDTIDSVKETLSSSVENKVNQATDNAKQAADAANAAQNAADAAKDATDAAQKAADAAKQISGQ